MSTSCVVYAIDIGDSLMRGGTHIDRETLEIARVSTPRASRDKSGEQMLLEGIAAMVEAIAAVSPRMQALAVSCSGIMTLQPTATRRTYGPFRDRELYVLAPNVDGLKQVPIIARLEQLDYGVPIHVENDCNAALRSAEGIDDAICVNLGAGLGASVMRHGRIEHVEGTWSCHEIGHGMRYRLPEEVTRRCHCGNLGCLEAVIGGWAMTERYRTRPENALADIYDHMRDDVVEFLPKAIADTITETGITTVFMSGKGAVGYSRESDFLDRLRLAVEALVPQYAPIQMSLLDLGEIAELRGVALAMFDCGIRCGDANPE